MIDKAVKNLDFDEIEIYKFGNVLEISGMIVSNGEEVYLIPFPNIELFPNDLIHQINTMSQEDWTKLLFQLDHLEAVVRAKDETGKLQKIILRKSQRQMDSNISWDVFRRDDYTCQYCGRNDVPLTVDHIIRWENMGQSVEDNLISACRKCNKTRGNTEMEDWLNSDYYKDNIKKIKKVINDRNMNDLEQQKMTVGELQDRRNRELFEKAKQLPLRKFERSR